MLKSAFSTIKNIYYYIYICAFLLFVRCMYNKITALKFFTIFNTTLSKVDCTSFSLPGGRGRKKEGREESLSSTQREGWAIYKPLPPKPALPIRSSNFKYGKGECVCVCTIRRSESPCGVKKCTYMYGRLADGKEKEKYPPKPRNSPWT